MELFAALFNELLGKVLLLFLFLPLGLTALGWLVYIVVMTVRELRKK